MAPSIVLLGVLFTANFLPIKVGTSAIPHFRVISTEKSISYTILMIQRHYQGQKVNFMVNHVKISFLTN